MVKHSCKLLELLRNTMLICCKRLPVAGASCLSCSKSCILCCIQASTFSECSQARVMGSLPPAAAAEPRDTRQSASLAHEQGRHFAVPVPAASNSPLCRRGILFMSLRELLHPFPISPAFLIPRMLLSPYA
eukprot:213904-Pelagomonas_calceolata.AAC.1